MKDEVNSQPVKLVIEHIKKQIAERQILPGERLPSERKLSELLKVSRSHVREADTPALSGGSRPDVCLSCKGGTDRKSVV